LHRISKMSTIRQHRARTQPIYLLEHRESKDGTSDEFIVMGTSGVSYQINVQRANSTSITCTCPDFVRRQLLCKHCYFIQDSGVAHTKSLIVSQKTVTNADICPICFESMVENNSSQLIWCTQTCGQSMHKSCMDIYRKYKSECPFCRSKI